MTTAPVQSQIPEYSQGNPDCSEESVPLVFCWGLKPFDIHMVSPHVSYMFCGTSIKALI